MTLRAAHKFGLSALLLLAASGARAQDTLDVRPGSIDQSTYAPCIDSSGDAGILVARFQDAGWTELTSPDDRLFAAGAVQEIRFLFEDLPARAQSVEELDRLLTLLHERGARFADSEEYHYLSRGNLHLEINVYGDDAGGIRRVQCLIAGNDLPGVATVLEQQGEFLGTGLRGDAPMAARYMNFEYPDVNDRVRGLSLDLLEHVADFEPTMPVRARYGILVSYSAQEQR